MFAYCATHCFEWGYFFPMTELKMEISQLQCGKTAEKLVLEHFTAELLKHMQLDFHWDSLKLYHDVVLGAHVPCCFCMWCLRSGLREFWHATGCVPKGFHLQAFNPKFGSVMYTVWLWNDRRLLYGQCQAICLVNFWAVQKTAMKNSPLYKRQFEECDLVFGCFWEGMDWMDKCKHGWNPGRLDGQMDRLKVGTWARKLRDGPGEGEVDM